MLAVELAPFVGNPDRQCHVLEPLIRFRESVEAEEFDAETPERDLHRVDHLLRAVTTVEAFDRFVGSAQQGRIGRKHGCTQFFAD